MDEYSAEEIAQVFILLATRADGVEIILSPRQMDIAKMLLRGETNES